jgi:1,2-diacylglycerol 3-alpha-glucosyltransferase
MNSADTVLRNWHQSRAKPLRVLMISDVYAPRVNGVSTSIQTFRPALVEHGVQVTLVAPQYPSATEETDVIRLPSRAVPLDPEDRLMHWSELANLDRRLASTDFDVVHVQTPFAAHYAGVRFARHRHLPCVTTYHTHFEEYLFHYIPFLPKSAMRSAARLLARQQCNALDAVIVPSNAMATTLRDYGVSTPLRILPTGLPEAQFIRGDGKRFREQHGIGPERRVTLFVGRAAHEKNIGFLLETIAIACRTRPEILLVIAGEGPALDSLKQQAAKLMIENHVCFVGYLERESSLRDCYAAADLFTFASLTETQGLVLLEAMAVGLPVLAIPALGAAEIIRPLRGAVCASRIADNFAAQVVTLLDSPTALAELSAEAIDFAREWSADRQATKLAELYRELASAPVAVEFSQPVTVNS